MPIPTIHQQQKHKTFFHKDEKGFVHFVNVEPNR